MNEPDDLLTTAEVALILRAPVSTVRYWRYLERRAEVLQARAPRRLPARRRPHLARRAGSRWPRAGRQLITLAHSRRGAAVLENLLDRLNTTSCVTIRPGLLPTRARE